MTLPLPSQADCYLLAAGTPLQRWRPEDFDQIRIVERLHEPLVRELAVGNFEQDLVLGRWLQFQWRGGCQGNRAVATSDRVSLGDRHQWIGEHDRLTVESIEKINRIIDTEKLRRPPPAKPKLV